MTPRELLAEASTFFGRLVAGVDAEDWARPTPCEDWNLGALVDHVVGGNRYTVEILSGASSRDAMTSAIESFQIPMDRTEAVATSLAAQEDAFASADALDRICHHEVGDVPASRVLGMRLTDLTLHGWDVASSMGTRVDIDPALVAAAWADMEPMRDTIPTIGVFGAGPSGQVMDDADILTRLLDLSGRDPAAWRIS